MCVRVFARLPHCWAATRRSELQQKVNCRLKVNFRKKIGLVCQLLAKPAQILSNNSLSAAIHMYMIRVIVWLPKIALFFEILEHFELAKIYDFIQVCLKYTKGQIKIFFTKKNLESRCGCYRARLGFSWSQMMLSIIWGPFFIFRPKMKIFSYYYIFIFWWNFTKKGKNENVVMGKYLHFWSKNKKGTSYDR